MKKRTKITLRTKIYLTIVALLAHIGTFYAANALPFATIPGPPGAGPVGVVALPGQVLGTSFCNQDFFTLDCNGNFSVLAQIPNPPVQPCVERYLAVAPIQSTAAGFTPRDVFITQGDDIYKFSGGIITPFKIGFGCPFSDHSSVAFDKVGTFGFALIVTCENGLVFTIDGFGTVTPRAAIPGAHLEGPAVAPLSFGPLGGQILAADDIAGQVHAIKNDGTVTRNAFNWSPPDWDGAESVQVIPSTPCANCSGGSYFQAVFDTQQVVKYLPIDFTGLAGSVLVNSENHHGTAVVTFNPVTNAYDTMLFDIFPGQQEGASFVDCDVPPQCNLTVTHRRSFGETVQITILNSGSTDQFITNLALSWPQGINGKLTQIKLDGVVLWNGPAANSPINFGVPPLVMNPHKRKIAHNSTEVLKFIFQNNVAPLNNPVYNGSATFESGCSLDFGLPTRRPR